MERRILSSTSKDIFEAFRRDEWPFRHDEFDEWPAHMRPPMHMRTGRLAFDPITMTAVAAAGATAASSASAALPAIGAGSALAGGGIGAIGNIMAGNNAAAMGQYQAQELNQQGETATATGQRAMLEERRKTGLVESSLQARAAGSGGTSTDPSVLGLGRQIAQRGEYNALMDLSQGQNQAAGLQNQASAAQYGGQIGQQGDQWSAAGTLAGGAGSFARSLQYGSLPQYSSYAPALA
jgi:hypothetical protein